MDNDDFKGRIAIVGSGAVGCYYGAKLATQSFDVHFLMRRDYEHVSQHGLRILSDDGDITLPAPKCFRSTEEIGPCDLVIIALKATDNDVLRSLLPPLIQENTILLTLQNGLGNEAFLAEAFGAEHVMGGLCFVCLNRTAPGVIEHYSQGMISIGEFGRRALPRTHAVGGAFQKSGVRCQVMEDLLEARWQKLAWNIPFNGLPIVLGDPDVAAILADPTKKAHARNLMEEVVSIARTQSVELDGAYLDVLMERTHRMGPYKPSSLLDYLAGRPMEVEAIWGEPWRVARDHGVDAPHLRRLYDQLRQRSGDL